MREPVFPKRLELPEGEYVARPVHMDSDTDELIVLFRLHNLTEEAKKKGHPQTGLGGRMARAYFAIKDENTITRLEESNRLSQLLTALGVNELEEALGVYSCKIRVLRTISRANPSQYRTSAVEFEPIEDLLHFHEIFI